MYNVIFLYVIIIDEVNELKITQAITYILILIITFLTIYFLEVYFFFDLFELFNLNVNYKMLIILFINIIINPFIVAIIVKDIKFINKPWN